jgi:hypothetical protein
MCAAGPILKVYSGSTAGAAGLLSKHHSVQQETGRTYFKGIPRISAEPILKAYSHLTYRAAGTITKGHSVQPTSAAGPILKADSMSTTDAAGLLSKHHSVQQETGRTYFKGIPRISAGPLLKAYSNSPI